MKITAGAESNEIPRLTAEAWLLSSYLIEGAEWAPQRMSDLPNARARLARLVGTIGLESLWNFWECFGANQASRRKKTRCPGEKPICSFCERLGQDCFYTGSAEAIDEGSEFAKNMVRGPLIRNPELG